MAHVAITPSTLYAGKLSLTDTSNKHVTSLDCMLLLYMSRF